MRVAVTGHLVAAIYDHPYQTGTALGHPTQNEKSCANLPLGEQIQQPQRVALHLEQKAVPGSICRAKAAT